MVFRDKLRIGNIPVPCESAVSDRGTVEIENGFILAEERNIDESNNIRICRKRSCDDNLPDSGFFVSDKAESLNAACIFAAHFEYDIACVDGNGVVAAGRRDGKLGRNAVDGIKVVLGEGYRIGHGDMHGLAAQNHAVQHELDFNITACDGGKNAFRIDGCDGFIRYAPARSFGKLGGVSGFANADSPHGKRGSGG